MAQRFFLNTGEELFFSDGFKPGSKVQVIHPRAFTKERLQLGKYQLNSGEVFYMNADGTITVIKGQKLTMRAAFDTNVKSPTQTKLYLKNGKEAFIAEGGELKELAVVVDEKQLPLSAGIHELFDKRKILVVPGGVVSKIFGEDESVPPKLQRAYAGFSGQPSKKSVLRESFIKAFKKFQWII